MSSGTYSTTIIPDTSARRLLFAISVACALAGVGAIALLPWPWPARGALVLAWLGYWSFHLSGQLRATAGIRAYTIHEDGAVRIARDDAGPVMARLRGGTTVGRQSAWLRFESPGRRAWGELVIGPNGADKQLKNKDWRRLQVICRHLSAC